MTAKSATRRWKRKQSGLSLAFDSLNISFLVVLSLLILYPFWQTLTLSFSSAQQASSLGFHLWPEKWQFQAYEYLLTQKNILGAYSNTIYRTVVGTCLIVVFTILGAYPLSKKELPFRNGITMYFLFAMFFSGGLIPTYLLIKSLGLLDSLWVLVIPSAVNIFNIIIMRNFLMTIDKAYEESAFMDGANYFTVLTRIILPLSKPVIATIVLWSAVAHWNSWFDAMIYIRDHDKTVVQVIIREMMTALSETTDISRVNPGQDSELLLSNVRAATVIISIGPIVMLYPFLQKYFIKGITIGSLKG